MPPRKKRKRKTNDRRPSPRRPRRAWVRYSDDKLLDTLRGKRTRSQCIRELIRAAGVVRMVLDIPAQQVTWDQVLKKYGRKGET